MRTTGMWHFRQFAVLSTGQTVLARCAVSGHGRAGFPGAMWHERHFAS